MAHQWQMPFASSRGYASLTLQHDVAELLIRRHAQSGQLTIVYFLSDHDRSGFDLQRAWEEALENFFGAPVGRFVRLALTTEQVRDPDLDIAPWHNHHEAEDLLPMTVVLIDQHNRAVTVAINASGAITRH
jgi:hypothetical protein